MNTHVLDFEKPLVELDNRIKEVCPVFAIILYLMMKILQLFLADDYFKLYSIIYKSICNLVALFFDG